MGNVGVIAAAYLVQRLGLQLMRELNTSHAAGGSIPGWGFEPQAIEIRAGVLSEWRTPRNLIYQPPLGHPLAGRLTVFIGESQPSFGGLSLCNSILDIAQALGCSRVVTLAAMASQLHPLSDPSVHGAVTSEDLITELQRIEARPIAQGQIGGLNGVLLGAVMQRTARVTVGMPSAFPDGGLCLMGEIPFFAPGVPNPKAAKAVLESLSLLSGFEIQVEDLTEQAKQIDQMLVQMWERVQAQQQAGQGSEFPDDEEESSAEGAVELEADTEQATPEPEIDAATKARIEAMFAHAHQDKSAAMGLKKELDRLGVFKIYENRFLDLFRRAE
jgi:proteasome assembly chaperone (PAC2) family protein